MATSEAVKSRPILFSGPMVRAILAGTKTQTRRIIKPQPSQTPHGFAFGAKGIRTRGTRDVRIVLDNQKRQSWINDCCPFGTVGDELWVRETFVTGYSTDDSGYLIMTDADGEELPEKVFYRATESDDFEWTGEDGERCPVPWKPSIFMPRWASRITLRITSIRVERLQAITEEDAIAEGFKTRRPTRLFRKTWDQINGPGSWDANPWVWCVGFERIKPEPTP